MSSTMTSSRAERSHMTVTGTRNRTQELATREALMSPTVETPFRKLVVLASLVVFGSSLGFLLVACGTTTSSPAPPAQPKRGSAAERWHVLPVAPISLDAGL